MNKEIVIIGKFNKRFARHDINLISHVIQQFHSFYSKSKEDEMKRPTSKLHAIYRFIDIYR